MIPMASRPRTIRFERRLRRRNPCGGRLRKGAEPPSEVTRKMAAKKRTDRRAAGQQWTPKQVVDLATAHDLAELEVESGGLRVRVVRRHAPAAVAPLAVATPTALTQA